MHLFVLHPIMYYQCTITNHFKLPLHCNSDGQMQFSGVRNKLISALPLRVADEGTSVYGGKV